MPSGTETVTVIRKPKVDKLTPASGTTPEEFDLEGCQLLPRRAQEEGQGWVSVDGWEVWCFKNPGREILFSDQIRIRGDLYSIEGTPSVYDKRGTFKALQVTTKRVGSKA